jgi:hypothetical protein
MPVAASLPRHHPRLDHPDHFIPTKIRLRLSPDGIQQVLLFVLQRARQKGLLGKTATIDLTKSAADAAMPCTVCKDTDENGKGTSSGSWPCRGASPTS